MEKRTKKKRRRNVLLVGNCSSNFRKLLVYCVEVLSEKDEKKVVQKEGSIVRSLSRKADDDKGMGIIQKKKKNSWKISQEAKKD